MVKKMARKGQTAMEYLMTYGWAILIIVVVGAVLFAYGVFSPAKLVPKTGCTSGNLYVDAKDWTTTAGSSLVLRFENRIGDLINVTAVGASDGTASSTTTSGGVPQTVSAGDKSAAITITGLTAGSTGDSRTFDLNVSYIVPSGVAGTRVYSCTITGKVGE